MTLLINTIGVLNSGQRSISVAVRVAAAAAATATAAAAATSTLNISVCTVALLLLLFIPQCFSITRFVAYSIALWVTAVFTWCDTSNIADIAKCLAADGYVSRLFSLLASWVTHNRAVFYVCVWKANMDERITEWVSEWVCMCGCWLEYPKSTHTAYIGVPGGTHGALLCSGDSAGSTSAGLTVTMANKRRRQRRQTASRQTGGAHLHAGTL